MQKAKSLVALCLITGIFSLKITAQNATISSDKDWENPKVALKNTLEADFIIRLGDVDNLGFGWPEGFDPFCGRMTDSHFFPWDVRSEDLPGFDRILLSSKFDPNTAYNCGADGYSGNYNPENLELTRPVEWSLPIDMIKETTINNAWIQVFIDDFQAPVLCSKFQMTINGIRFVEAEKLFNAIEQTGPVGKLISIPLPEEFYPSLRSGNTLKIKIDEIDGVADGFAVDFIRLLINRKRENSCVGNVRGYVLDKETQQPIANATVFSADKSSVKTDAEGRFYFVGLPTGFEVLSASFPGYADGAGTADIGEGDENPETVILLEKGAALAKYDNKSIKVGESINLNNILFDQGKSTLRPESIAELEKIVAFMQTNSQAEIELSGHTSSEGERAYNQSLSYQRVKACKEYIVAKGVDSGRIVAVGYGPDRPLVSNDTETNRARNRRVELRLVKL
ncbi:MAG: OmpA family protein [Bacteroidia bacterium]|nr:OmpA family protein [Bacteroidia bacterium]